MRLSSHILIIGFCLRLLHDLALKYDVVRYVESHHDPKTGEEVITHVYEKGELPKPVPKSSELDRDPRRGP